MYLIIHYHSFSLFACFTSPIWPQSVFFSIIISLNRVYISFILILYSLYFIWNQFKVYWITLYEWFSQISCFTSPIWPKGVFFSIIISLNRVYISFILILYSLSFIWNQFKVYWITLYEWFSQISCFTSTNWSQIESISFHYHSIHFIYNICISI
jgi:hypothetical protein